MLRIMSRECSDAGPRRGLVCAVVVALLLMPWLARRPLAQTDLDAFMQQVLAERDSNWKKLQQYILDEREQVEMRGPSGTNLSQNPGCTTCTFTRAVVLLEGAGRRRCSSAARCMRVV